MSEAHDEMHSKVAGWYARVSQSPARFLVPGAAMVAVVLFAVNGYTPLQFQEPQAAATTDSGSLGKSVDASKLEKKHTKKVNAKAGSKVNANDLKDGTYTGYSRCTENGVFDYYLALDVTIKGGKVVKVGNIRGTGKGKSGSADLGSYDARNTKYLNWAVSGRNGQSGVVKQLVDAASKGKVASSIDTVSGATYSSESILEAYQDAISQASRSGKSLVTAKAKAKRVAEKALKRKVGSMKSVLTKNAKLADGTFVGYDRCTEEDTFDYYVALKVTVKDGKVTKISDIHGSATGDSGSKKLSGYDTVNDSYLTWAKSGRNGQTGVVNQILAAAKKGSIATSVDAVTGATYSSDSILRAYQNALQKSAKKAGSSAKVPTSGKKNTGGGSSKGGGTSGGSGPNGSGASSGVTIKQANSGLADGTYSAFALAGDPNDEDMDFTPYYVSVSITVVGGKVAEVKADDIVPETSVDALTADPGQVINSDYLYDSAENAYYYKRALNGYGISGNHPGLVQQFNTGLTAGAALTDYDTISGATYTSDAIIEAYTRALAKATPSVGGGAESSMEAGASDGSRTGADTSSNAAANVVAAVQSAATGSTAAGNGTGV